MEKWGPPGAARGETESQKLSWDEKKERGLSCRLSFKLTLWALPISWLQNPSLRSGPHNCLPNGPTGSAAWPRQRVPREERLGRKPCQGGLEMPWGSVCLSLSLSHTHTAHQQNHLLLHLLLSSTSFHFKAVWMTLEPEKKGTYLLAVATLFQNGIKVTNKETLGRGEKVVETHEFSSQYPRTRHGESMGCLGRSSRSGRRWGWGSRWQMRALHPANDDTWAKPLFSGMERRGWLEKYLELKVRGWKKMFNANGKQKKAGVAILISEKNRL